MPENQLTSEQVEFYKVWPGNLDTEASRVQRAKLVGDVYFERLDDLVGKPVAERFETLRRVLCPHVGQIYPEGWPARIVDDSSNAQVNLRQVDGFQSQLFDLVDGKIKETDNEAQRLRLMVAFYLAEVLIHPLANGNGQMTKVMMTSLFNEFRRENRRYFPIKFSQLVWHYPGEIKFDEDSWQQVEVPAIKLDTEKWGGYVQMVQEIKQLWKEYYDITGVSRQDDEQRQDIFGEVQQIWKSERERFGLPEINFKLDDDNCDYEVDDHISQALMERLIEEGYDEDRVLKLLYDFETTRGKVTYLVGSLLGEWSKMLEKYIDTGELADLGDKNWNILTGQLKQVEQRLKTIMADDSLSSEKAIRQQLGWSERYGSLRERLNKLLSKADLGNAIEVEKRLRSVSHEKGVEAGLVWLEEQLETGKLVVK